MQSTASASLYKPLKALASTAALSESGVSSQKAKGYEKDVDSAKVWQ